jgi:hypothetical protein
VITDDDPDDEEYTDSEGSDESATEDEEPIVLPKNRKHKEKKNGECLPSCSYGTIIALDSAPFDFSDYSVTFTVPRHVTDPIRLNETKYGYLVEKALEIKTNPFTRILVEPKVVQKLSFDASSCLFAILGRDQQRK